MIKELACAAALAATAIAAPASAGKLELGVLDCTIDGGAAYLVASNKGVSRVYRPHHGGTRNHDSDDLAGSYYGVNAEASVATGGGANLLVGGLDSAFSLQPLSVQAQTGVNLAVAVTSLDLIHSFK